MGKHLKTLDEDQDDAPEPIMVNDDIKDNKKESESEHIQKVRERIKECLNLGEDSLMLSGQSTPSTPALSQGFTMENVEDINVSLQRLEASEEILELMEHALYQCPDTATMTKWDNRYNSHKARINNFRKILNGMLSSKIMSMKDENTTLLKQLESNQSNQSLQDMADLHHQINFENKKSAKKKGRTRSKTSILRRKNSDISDDDVSSVDSEVNLVYTKGTKLSSKESETLINRVKLQKKEIKKYKKELKKLKEAHKLEMVKMKATIDGQNSKIKSYEKARQSMVGTQQNIQQQMRKLKKTKQMKSGLIQVNKDQSAASQREISVLRKQLKNITNELEAEQERKRNLQKKLTRVITANNNESKGSGNSTVSMNKLKRLQKEKDKLEQECIAKTKKMDEMFLKYGSKDRKYQMMEDENADLKAKLGSYTAQIKEINKRTMELQSITDDRDRCLLDLEQLNKKFVKLNEKTVKLKSRNRKLKDRIKNLLQTIEEYDKLASFHRKLINELSALQRELNLVEIESAKYKNQNDSLNAKIKELKNKMKGKKLELESTNTKLEKFRDDLSAEFSVIRSLQDQLEEKENAMNDLSEQHQAEQNKNLSEKELLENEKEELSMDLIRSKAQIEQSTKIIDRYKSKCDKYEQQINDLNEKLINYENNEMVKYLSNINELKQQIEEKNDEIQLLKKKNNAINQQLIESKDTSDAVKEKNDEIDDLMNKIEQLNNKNMAKDEKYKNKCNEYDELMAKYNKLSKELEAKELRIKKLNIKIKQYESDKMQQDDDTKLKLKQYNVQIVTIEENKKLIEKLRQKVGELKTLYQLEQEALVRHKKATKGLEEENEESQKTIKAQKKKIKKLQNELDTSGYGDSKQKSTLSLLRKNVDEMESIIRTKNFEIKKLKNNMKAHGMQQNDEDSEKMIKKMKKDNQALTNKLEKIQKNIDEQKNELNANKELLTTKNEEISKLKIEISELKEYQNQMIEEQKENESLKKKLSQNKNETNQEIEKLNDKIKELQDELVKVEKEKQRKIDSLEVELADKDAVLLQIGKQVGTDDL